MATPIPLAPAKVGDLEVPISGFVEQRFTRVLDAFRDNFSSRGEIGASVAAYVDGAPVIDLWGGHIDAERKQTWNSDTLVCTMSVAKGIAAICAHIQVGRGVLDLDAPVAQYWPEYAQAGKGATTVRQLMSHQAAVPVADAAPEGSALGWDALIRGLEVQEPLWAPGSKAVYHSTTFGHLVGELVSRTSGKSLSDFIRDELATPLGAEVILGVDKAQLCRVAPNIFNPANELLTRAPKADPLFARTYRLAMIDGGMPSFEAMVGGTFASGGAVSNAQGLARIFAALASGGRFNGVRLMTPDTIAHALEQQSWEPDPMHGDPFRNAVGLLLNTPTWTYFGPNPDSFGAIGGGGYGVFADRENRLSFSYTPGRFTSGYGWGDEARALVDSLYASL